MNASAFGARARERVRALFAGRDPVRLLLLTGLFLLYCALAGLKNGGDVWWHLDIVGGSNLGWGDDAYRSYLARAAWSGTDIYWFNFVLPVALLFDGLVTSLTPDALVYARYAKALATAVSVVLLYSSLSVLEVRRGTALAASLVFGLMPLAVFIGLSFYGEAWLAFLLSLAAFLLVTHRYKAAYLVIALMPLVRPEGILFVGVFSLWGLARRDWAGFLLPPSLGFVYFLSIPLLGPGFDIFLSWRGILRNVYAAGGDWYGGRITDIGENFSVLWLFLGVIGFWFVRRQRVALLLPGALLVLLYGAGAMLLERAAFEARYYASFLPVFALGFGLFLEHGRRYVRREIHKWAGHGLVSAVVVWAFAANLMTMHAPASVIKSIQIHGDPPPVVQKNPLDPASYFQGISPKGLEWFRELADVVERMTRANPDIRTLIVGNVRLFYFLDSSDIPDRVRVAFPPFRWKKLGPIMDFRATAAYFPEPPYGGTFDLNPPRPAQPQILYVDYMEVRNYSHHWKVGPHDIYLYGGDLNDSAWNADFWPILQSGKTQSP